MIFTRAFLDKLNLVQEHIGLNGSPLSDLDGEVAAIMKAAGEGKLR